MLFVHNFVHTGECVCSTQVGVEPVTYDGNLGTDITLRRGYGNQCTC